MAAAVSGSRRKARRIASIETINTRVTGRQIQRDQDARRLRGEIACAECARMKLRCDRNVPCASCLRRGCSNICPNGMLSGKVGSRLVLANTEDLHSKLHMLCERIRQLEDALEILQKSVSSDRHPLLREELLEIKRGIDVRVTVPADPPADSDLSDAFGTLTISDHGISRFIGPTGGAESLIMCSPDVPKDPGDRETHFLGLAPRAPFSFLPSSDPVNDEISISAILNVQAKLPSRERASSLCETYLEHATWLGRPVRRMQLIDELLVPTYSWKQAIDAALPSDQAALTQNIHPFELALLLMVFAIGALNDLTLPPYNEEAEQYYQMTRSIVHMGSLIEKPTLESVQMLCLTALYHSQSKQKESGETNWCLMRLASVIGFNIGLHRDPARWKLEDKIVQRRRDVFWQIFAVENLQSVSSGRPPINVLRYVDCELPEYIDQKGDQGIEFCMYRFRFAKEILSPLNDLTCSVGPIKYSDTLALDRKIHEFSVPPELRIRPEGFNLEKDGTLPTLLRFATAFLREITLLNLHHSFFCKALIDCPVNPLKTKYAPSCLSTYRSALYVLKISRELANVFPYLISRCWLIWKHSFSCLVVLGSIVTRGPNSDLAPTALAELTRGIELFEKAAPDTDKAKKALVVLRNLQGMAYHAYVRSRNVQPPGTYDTPVQGQGSNWIRELSIFGGLGAQEHPNGEVPQPTAPLPSRPSTFSDQSDIDAPIQLSSSLPVDSFQHADTTSCFSGHPTLPCVPAEDLDLTTFNWEESAGSSFPVPPEQGGPEPQPMSVSYDGTNTQLLNDPSASGALNLPHVTPIDATSQTYGSVPMYFAQYSGAFGFGSSGDQPMDEQWIRLMHEFNTSASNPYMPSSQS